MRTRTHRCYCTHVHVQSTGHRTFLELDECALGLEPPPIYLFMIANSQSSKQKWNIILLYRDSQVEHARTLQLPNKTFWFTTLRSLPAGYQRYLFSTSFSRRVRLSPGHVECKPFEGMAIPRGEAVERLLRKKHQPHFSLTTALSADGNMSGERSMLCLTPMPGYACARAKALDESTTGSQTGSSSAFPAALL